MTTGDPTIHRILSLRKWRKSAKEYADLEEDRPAAIQYSLCWVFLELCILCAIEGIVNAWTGKNCRTHTT